MRVTVLAICAIASACSGEPQRASAPATLPPSAAVGPSSTAAGAAPAVAALVAIPGARQPLPGVVTGGVPSDENLREAKRLGYTTVVSLLSTAELDNEQERVERAGLRFVSIPVAGEPDLTETNARRLGTALSDPQARPLILHCASGNRAGALLALEGFYVEGLSSQAALDLGMSAGMTKLHDGVQRRMTSAGAGPREPVPASR